MDIILNILGFLSLYILVGFGVVVFYISPWLRRLSPEKLENLLGDIEGLKFETEKDLEIARTAYLISIAPVWPVYAAKVAFYGKDLS